MGHVVCIVYAHATLVGMVKKIALGDHAQRELQSSPQSPTIPLVAWQYVRTLEYATNLQGIVFAVRGLLVLLVNV